MVEKGKKEKEEEDGLEEEGIVEEMIHMLAPVYWYFLRDKKRRNDEVWLKNRILNNTEQKLA